MTENKKISVITGIYNCADTLDEAIESILNQTYSNWNMIMCDDCSSDNTYQKAKEYEKKYPEKFIVIKNDANLGLNKTLNKCLKLADGDYIARMDGDDISLPTRFEKEARFLDENPDYAIVSAPMIYFDENGDWGKCKAIEKPTVNDFNSHSPFFCHAVAMIRREAYINVNGYSEDPRTLRSEDTHLWYKMYAKGYKGYNLSEHLYKMRDDRNAYHRRTFKSRMNNSYVEYIGHKMLKMPLYSYIFVAKKFIINVILGIMPSKLYMAIHKRRLQ